MALGPAIWAPVALFAGAAVIALIESDFPVGWGPLAALVFQIGLGILVSVTLGERAGRLGKAGKALSALMQASTIASAGVILAYCAATAGHPLVDSAMLRFDRMIGYDWRAFALFFASHPSFARLTILCYNSNVVQPVLLILLLIQASHYERLEKFVVTMTVTLALTILIFIFYPVTTAWTYEWHSPARLAIYRYLLPGTDGWIHELLQIRQGYRPPSGTFWQGIIGFPSFHTISALLYIWAAWPLRWARMIFVPANILMILGALLSGGHYAADLVCGVIITAIGLSFTHSLYDAARRFRYSERAGWALASTVPESRAASVTAAST
ncbi:phosphatase PAP2 family protein [Flavisphingomonas formosensis]|uniref:phosphatase PAP2 family protein n=1 Tax=Flavisphingomonas formosensis TaxID=861534 RepID=UPI0012F829E8|nr:phosphatase PAP2 family protein [Sphingomonas formosensis]